MWLLTAGGDYERMQNEGHVEGADDDDWSFFLNARFNLKLDAWLGN
jgi:hypothetical protein